MEIDSRTLLERVAALSGLFGIISLVFYAVLRTGYTQFYNHAGIEPEEVGLTKAALLGQAVTGPVFLLLATSIMYFVILTAWKIASRTEISNRLVATISMGIATVLLIVDIFLASSELTSDLDNGDAARTSFFDFGLVKIPLLQVWALPVKLEWSDPTKATPRLKSGTNCMFYLGEANGTGVLFDVRTREIVRFKNEGIVVITSREPELLPRECVE